MPTITFNDVSVVHDDTATLRHIDLTITESRVGIIGANGSGKSTLARLINGLGEPTLGTVTYDGADVSKNGKEVRTRVGFIFSDAENQIVMPGVLDDVEFSLRRFKLPKEERRRRALKALEKFGLTAHAEQSPHLLSGGEKQLLALAAVLVAQPDTVIADEPTTLLDLSNRLRIRREFAALSQQLVVITHDLELVSDFERIIRIDRGRVVDDGAPGEVIQRYITDMEKRSACS